MPPTSVWDQAIAAVWAELPSTSADDAGYPSVDGDARRLPAAPSGLAVDELAVASVAATLRAGALLTAARSGRRPPQVAFSAAHVADAVRSEAFLRINGQRQGGGFAPLSRFWETADGWLRTHANYPWHLAALLRATAAPSPEAVAEVLLTRPALEWEQAVDAADGVAVAVRPPRDWAASEPGRSVSVQGLVESEVIGSAPPRRRPSPDDTRPAERIRVLDLTRVIAGPVATRMLGTLGADVLRVDSPYRPELDFHRIEGLLGKRSTLLDARAEGRSRVHELLDGADVLVYGYRPSASLQLSPDELAARYPGLVVVRLSAWGERGPWAGRRGFDSLVQAASGIAVLQGRDDGQPGALPCQLLDHATGYLAAAAALLGLRAQSQSGGTHLLRLSLAATARFLLSMTPLPLRESLADSEDWTSPIRAADGRRIAAVRPPGAFNGVRLRWPEPVNGYGSNELAWR